MLMTHTVSYGGKEREEWEEIKGGRGRRKGRREDRGREGREREDTGTREGRRDFYKGPQYQFAFTGAAP